jgi:hypothetical protein
MPLRFFLELGGNEAAGLGQPLHPALMKTSENAINNVPLQIHEHSVFRKWAGRKTPCHTLPDIAEEMSTNIQKSNRIVLSNKQNRYHGGIFCQTPETYAFFACSNFRSTVFFTSIVIGNLSLLQFRYHGTEDFSPPAGAFSPAAKVFPGVSGKFNPIYCLGILLYRGYGSGK